MKQLTALLSLPLLAIAPYTFAVPVINGVQGVANHKSSISITGSGFGTKTSAAPAVWEDCSSGALSKDWSGAWPNRSANATNNTACRTPIRSIPLPHSNVSRYVAGGHVEAGGADAGYNVILYRNRTISSYPAYTYASWYQRVDDNWTFCGDNNFKVFDFSMGGSPYTMPENWYLEYNSRPTSKTSTAAWHLLDDAGNVSLSSPDANGRSWWWDSAVNPMSGVWTKIELEIRYSKDSSGYIKLWENGKQKINYAGKTDGYAGSQRSEGIGGYARCYGSSSNWRYFSDVYLDNSRARVVLTDNADYTKASTFEPQIPASWTGSKIDIITNLGRIASGSQAYLFVFDETGARNSVGYPLTGGQSVTELSSPKPPSDVMAQ